MYFAGLTIADPQFDRLGSEIHERESLSVSRPHGPARASALGKRDRNPSPIGKPSISDVHQFEGPGAGGDAVTARSVVLAVVPWLHAHASQAQKRCRHPRDRGIVLPRHQQNRVLGRAHPGYWW